MTATAQRRKLRPLGPGGSAVWRYMHDQTTREVFAGGSSGPGKTFDMCLVEVSDALKYAGSIGGIFRHTAKDLRQSTLRTFFEVCECVNWEQGGLREGVHYKYNETKGEVSWYTGSKTYFDYLSYEPSDPNYSRFGGRAYTRCGVDEADECEERGVTMVGTRIIYRLTDFCHECAAQNMSDLSEPLDCDDEGTPCLWRCYNCGATTKGLVPKLLCTGNPGDYWTKYRYVTNEDGSMKQLPDHMARVLMLLDDNPDKAHAAARRRQLESGSDDYDKQRLLYGNWSAVRKTGREFLHAFKTIDHVKRVAYDPAKPLHITLDFNTAPYMTLLVAQLHMQPDGRWHCAFLQEICLKHPESTTEASCKALVQEMTVGKYAGHNAGLFFYGDASGKAKDTLATYHNYDIVEKVLAKWRSSRWDRVINSNPAHTIVRDFYNSCLRGERRHCVTFDPSMTNTIADMLNVKEGADGRILKQMEKDHITGVTAEKYGHCLQASYYLTVSAFADEFATFAVR